MQTASLSYAGILQRAAAFSVDFVLIRCLIEFLKPLSSSLKNFFIEVTPANANNPEIFLQFAWATLFIHWAIWVVYFIGFEQSRLKATPGQILFKIRVSDLGGQLAGFRACVIRNLYLLLPIALYQCVGVLIVVQEMQMYGNTDDIFSHVSDNLYDIRHISSIAVVALLVVTALLMVFSKRRQALQDILARTLVIKTDDNPLKRLYLKASSLIKYLRKTNFSDHK